MSFISSQSLLLSILDQCGFFTFDIESSIRTKRRIIFSVFVYISSFLCSITSSYFYSQTSEEFIRDESNVTRTIHDAEISTNLISQILIIYAILIRIKPQQRFFELFRCIENRVAALNFSGVELENFYTKIKIRSKLWIGVYMMFYSILLYIYVFMLTKNESLSHQFLCAMYMIFTCYFTTIAVLLYYQVTSLVKFLYIINKNLRFFISTSSSFYYERQISELFKLIFDFQSIISLWSSSFGLTAFALFVFIFGILSTETYFTFAIFQFSNKWESDSIYYLYAVCNLIWCLPVVIAMNFIGLSCSRVHDELDEFSKILRKNSECCRKDIATLIEKFLTHFNHSDYHFTTNEFFIIDGSFIYKVI